MGELCSSRHKIMLEMCSIRVVGTEYTPRDPNYVVMNSLGFHKIF